MGFRKTGNASSLSEPIDYATVQGGRAELPDPAEEAPVTEAEAEAEAEAEDASGNADTK